MALSSAKLLELLNGGRIVQALHAAAVLGIADLLHPGSRTCAELAGATGAHERSLGRLLRVLASIEVVEKHGDSFTLTPLGDLLRKDAPGSLHAAVVFYGSRRHWVAWGRLLECIKSGNPAMGPLTHDAFLAMAARDPEGATTLNEAMVALTGPLNAAVTAGYDFSQFDTLIDIGGGYGALLAGILQATPRLRGILFDIPAVIEGARPHIIRAGVAERCELVGGNFFEGVPAGSDAYLLKWILHDWNDETCLQILANCRVAMPGTGTLLLVERIVPPSAGTTPGTVSTLLSDLNMLVLSGGGERTEGEYRHLLTAAGFMLARIVRTSTPHGIIEAHPA